MEGEPRLYTHDGEAELWFMLSLTEELDNQLRVERFMGAGEEVFSGAGQNDGGDWILYEVSGEKQID